MSVSERRGTRDGGTRVDYSGDPRSFPRRVFTLTRLPVTHTTTERTRCSLQNPRETDQFDLYISKRSLDSSYLWKVSDYIPNKNLIDVINRYGIKGRWSYSLVLNYHLRKDVTCRRSTLDLRDGYTPWFLFHQIMSMSTEEGSFTVTLTTEVNSVVGGGTGSTRVGVFCRQSRHTSRPVT